MNTFTTIVWLLPIVFMIHDFEEIIFFKRWFERNGKTLEARMPMFVRPLFARLGATSTTAFALAVAEEFVLLSGITVAATLTDFYLLWLGTFMAFALHLLMHIGQWIFARRYIPAIATTPLSLIYCGYSLYVILANCIFSASQIALWSGIGVVLLVVNLAFAHWLGNKFDDY